MILDVRSALASLVALAAGAQLLADPLSVPAQVIARVINSGMIGPHRASESESGWIRGQL
ncbi:MAG: hypothetical protein ACRDTJ_16000 [Pseudonocardiaceae bacterium]